ncbi:MAG: hypothetical protein Q9166_000457 [cf. Caloplaca sp. 2 TL-2023]
MPVAEVHGGSDSVVDGETRSPAPDLFKHDFYNPSRYRPKPQMLAGIVDSETPSPLSPVTPPDRLSPIEELDDNASLRSTKAANPPPFETTQQDDLKKPRSRPKSNEFDLQASTDGSDGDDTNVEKRVELLFSRQHLELIFADKELSIRFGAFLRTYRPESVPVLGYYLETIKALRTLKYAEAVVKGLEQIPGLEFTADAKGVTMTWILEDKASRALDILAQNDLPAFIAYIYVCIVDLALVERVTGKADMDGNDIAIGLAEVFTISGWYSSVDCENDEKDPNNLQDPSRPDNPLVFASEGTRRDGTPFVNLVMVVPLRDQNGKVRYYLGAQLDITELVKGSTGLGSLSKLVVCRCGNLEQTNIDNVKHHSDLMTEFQQLSETFSPQELQTLLKSQQRQRMDDQVNHGFDDLKGDQAKHVRTKSSLSNLDSSIRLEGFGSAPSLGFYQNYLLVRPHPSLRILFASQDLRVPGILQSPLMDQIGGSPRVRDDLYHALEAGQKVTAKVQWLSKSSSDGRGRWIHCTPLISTNGLIGVWMVILVDDDDEPPISRNQSQPEPMPATMEFNDSPEPTPWDSAKVERNQQNESSRSPSTANSSQTAVSDSVKPVYEKVPPIVKEIPEIVPLPFASNKPRGSTAGLSEPRSDAPIATNIYLDHDGLRRSTESFPRSRQQDRSRFGPLPEAQAFPIRPGPRIAGKTYSYTSEHGISSDDGRQSISSRGGDRPTSRDSHITVSQSNIQPPDIKWRRPGDHQEAGAPGRGGRAPIKLPGRPSQDEGQRPLAWKTKKSLSPYGFLFNE